ncbi:MAG: hypothetical protein BWY98_00307 [Tenericutes bacterium ADurb.BinA155]|nr:MAG: hypothetical protein BWY98_00307 [Tenericutes bacterium ADurb.BinA155]
MNKQALIVTLLAAAFCLTGCGSSSTSRSSGTGSFRSNVTSSASNSTSFSSASTGSSSTSSSNATSNSTGTSSSFPVSSSSSESSSSSSAPAQSYLITFANYDGSVLEAKEWLAGSTPSYSGSTPSRSSDAQHNYSFKGWSPKIVPVSAPAKYTAIFDPALNQYTITFANEDGSTLESKKWDYGALPEYSGADPTKAGDAQYAYAFDGWSPSIVAVTADATYTATFVSAVNSYTVTFKNSDGTVLEAKKWDYGTTPSYTGAVPTKSSDDQYAYAFTGWDPKLTNVTADATYTAQYSSSPYIALSSTQNKVSFAEGSGSFEATSSSNETVSFNYSSVSNVLGYFGRFSTNGFLANTAAIGGLEKIAICFADTNEVLVSYGWANGMYRVENHSLKPSQSGQTITYDFGLELPSFFKVSCSGSTLLLSNITIVYSGAPVDDPYSPGTEGLVMSLSDGKDSYNVSGYTGTAADVTINPVYRHLPVKGIKGYAFSNSIALHTLFVPASVVQLGADSFINCSSDLQISVDSNNASYIVMNSLILTRNGMTLICVADRRAANYIIPSSVTEIGVSAFANMTSLVGVEIPSSVTRIYSNAFLGCTSLASISIPATVNRIDSQVFSGCTSLVSASYSSSATSIGQSTFENCSSLASFTIPSSVQDIGRCAFYNCTSLTEIFVPSSVKSVGSCAFVNCTSLVKAEFPSLESLCSIAFGWFGANPLTSAHHLYIDGSEVTDLVIPSSISAIPGEAFSGGSFLSVLIPSSVTTIGGAAFRGCSSLRSLVIPSSVTSIASYAFSNCSSLVSVSFSSSIDKIDMAAFEGCTSLAKLEVPDFNALCSTHFTESSSNPLFYAHHLYVGGSEVTEVAIPSNCTEIGSATFAGALYLTNVSIPSSVTAIGHQAFSGCTSLSQVTIPSSVTSMGGWVFSGCTSLSQVTIPSSVASIFDEIFAGCTALKEVSILSSTMTAIPSKAFADCTSLVSVTLPSSIKTIGRQAFMNCTSLVCIRLPYSLLDIAEDAFLNCSSLIAVLFFGNPYFINPTNHPIFSGCSKSLVLLGYYFPDGTWQNDVSQISTGWTDGGMVDDGCLYGIRDGAAAFVRYVGSGSSVSIRSEFNGLPVTKIADGAFANCTALISVNIPTSVTTIGQKAFQGCSSLASIVLPSSITLIGSWAFSKCGSLVSVSIPTSVQKIEPSAFSDTYSLRSVTIPDSGIYVYFEAFCNLPNCTIYVQGKNGKNWGDHWATNVGQVVYNCSYRWDYTDGDYTCIRTWADTDEVYSYSGAATSLTLPSSGSSANVTGVSSNFLQNNAIITSVTIPDSYQKIDSGAFSGCTALKTIIIGSGIQSIGADAFQGCSSIEACYYKGTPEQWAALNFTRFGQSVAFYSEADMTGKTDHYYWHYAADGTTPVLWNA